MGHRVAQSLVGSEGCIIQPRRSCILQLKNGGNGRAPPRQRPPGVPKRASLQLPSHYLFNVTRPREDNARRHSQILPSLFFTFLFRSVDGFPPVWATLILFLYPGPPCIPSSPWPLQVTPFPSLGSSTFGSTFSRPVSPPLNANGLARSTGASDLLRVRKLELKELSTSGNPREIYRRARFHE